MIYASLLSDLGVYALHPGAEAAPAVLLEALVDVGAVEAVAGVARGAGAALEGAGGIDALEKGLIQNSNKKKRQKN